MNFYPISLENKVVLITGASSGFGEDAAWLFANEGCKVVLAARRIDRLQTLASRIQDAGGEAIAIPMDIVNADDVENMVNSAIDLYAQIDILFNNAGIGRVGWYEEYSMDRDIETLINVNLISDIVDSNPGNGVCATATNVCTLRATVMESNALAGADIIVLGTLQIYTNH